MTQPTTQCLAKGMLIVFEGLDGAGKTTQARLLSEKLRQAGYDVVSRKEPTDGPLGQKIRQLAEEGRQRVASTTEMTWFIEERRQDVEQHIRPALARGQIVLLDRYYFSNMAYQGVLGIADPEDIQRWNEVFAPQPDLLFLLEISPDEGLRRVQQDRKPDDFERLDYLQQVAALFNEMQFPYLQRIQATLAPEVIHTRIWQEVQAALARLQDNNQAPEGSTATP
jgi:dTMP kinase